MLKVALLGSALVLGACSLTACSPQQVATAQTDIATVTADVQTACNAVNGTIAVLSPAEIVLPQIAGVAVYANAACATASDVAAMVQKAINDPTTVSWINQLNTFIKNDL